MTSGVTPELVDDWSFDQTTGTVTDSVGGYDGTVTGSTVIVPGKVGDAASFDGTVSPITTSAPDLSAPWTVGVWVDPTQTSNSATLLSGTNSAIKLQQYGTGKVGITQFGVADYGSTYTVPLNTWTYLTLVDDGTLTHIYADGRPVARSPRLPSASRSAAPTSARSTLATCCTGRSTSSPCSAPPCLLARSPRCTQPTASAAPTKAADADFML